MKQNEEKIDSLLYEKGTKTLQITYAQYMMLKEKAEEARRIQLVKDAVLADLQAYLATGATASSAAPAASQPKSQKKPAPPVEKEVPPAQVEEKPAPAPKKAAPVAEKPAPAPKKAAPVAEQKEKLQIPPIKKEISKHFNKFDESGRLFNVFKQYYTFLNETCGGMMRVTMKDGICSLWNYDEWEEFAFVDIFENHLRIAIDSVYTDEVKSLDLCEVPRLLASRRNLICIQVDDLNNLALDVLTKAFREAGKQVK